MLAEWSESMSQAARIPKQAVLYLHVLQDPLTGRQTQYQCEDCCFWLEGERCRVMGPEDVARAHGTCGFFANAAGASALPEGSLAYLTPEQVGYEENEAGFSCKRCARYVPQVLGGRLTRMGGCMVVDFRSVGDDPGRIDPDACCNGWLKSPQTGDLRQEQFPW